MSFSPNAVHDDTAYLRALVAMDLNIPAHLRAKFDSADLIQDALLRVHRNAGALVGRSPKQRQAYLRKALASSITDWIRHFDTQVHRAARERSIEQSLDDSSARLGQVLVATQTSPSQKAVKGEELGRLADALKALTDRQGEAVTLHHLQGLTLEETAERMCTTEDSVAGLLRRGLETLRELLRDKG
ncbi:MAG: RNA polymerase sigma factor [Isosphaerales bacterium]